MLTNLYVILRSNQLLATMMATVGDLITVLQTFFPNELPLNRAMYVLLAVATLYPILRLHEHQVQQPRQPQRTAWLKSIGVLLMHAFHPEQLDPETWTDVGPGEQWADVMHQDIGALYEFLGLNEENNSPATFAPKPRLLICTPHLHCIIC